jgi:hypothetical protein
MLKSKFKEHRKIRIILKIGKLIEILLEARLIKVKATF